MEKFIYINNSLTEPICNEIVEKFECNCNNKQLLKINFDISYDHEWSNIKNTLINEIDKHINIYYENLDNNIFFFNNVHHNKTMNHFVIKKFNKNTCYSNFHNDCCIDLDNKKSRVLSFIFFLNTIDDGGEIDFFGYHKIKPEKGNIIIFPSEWFFPYSENVSISDDKYIIKGSIYIDI
jgi:hypothetical protein